MRWNQSLLYRVNDFWDPHPHPRYQGWFCHIRYLPHRRNRAWEPFTLNFEGTFKTHEFGTWTDVRSPLGAPHFSVSGISKGGMKCQQGN